MSGFGNEFSSEALKDALPKGQVCKFLMFINCAVCAPVHDCARNSIYFTICTILLFSLLKLYNIVQNTNTW
jgi:hypothetical protein